MSTRLTTALLALSAISLGAEPAVGAEPQADDMLLMQASETISLPVFNHQGHELGEVEDLIVNVEEGMISHVLVSSGGFLGIGARILPVPVPAVDFVERKGESEKWFVRIDLKREDVEKAPEVGDEVLRQLAEDDWSDAVNAFYRVEGEPRRREAGQDDLERATELVGEALMQQDGEEQLGKIAEIVFVADNGRIRYAAMSFGGFVGFGDKLFAIPWELLSFSRTEQAPSEMAVSFSAQISEKHLNEVGGFAEDNWPRDAQPRWGEQVKHTAERIEPDASLE
jgi:sporulation protein YlmC with PRC-barrel domain